MTPHFYGTLAESLVPIMIGIFFLISSASDNSQKQQGKKTILGIVLIIVGIMLFFKGAILGDFTVKRADKIVTQTVDSLVKVEQLKSTYDQPFKDFLVAVKKNNIDEVKRLYHLDSVGYYQDENGCRAIHYAAYLGNLEVCKMLYKPKSRDYRTDMGVTPLMCAVGSGNEELVKYFMGFLDDSEKSKKELEQSLIISVLKNNINLAKIFIDYGAPVDTEFRAVYIDSKFDKNLHLKKQYWVRSEWSRPNMLDLACIKGDLEMAKFLVSRGAKIYLDKSSAKKSPGLDIKSIHFAAFNGQTEVVKWLLDNGVNIDFQAGKNRLINLAAMSGNLELIQFLIDKGADIKSVSSSELLSNCVYNEHPKAIELFIKNGIVFDKNDCHNMMAFAASKSQLETVKVLLSTGLNVDEQLLRSAICMNGNSSDNNVENAKKLVEYLLSLNILSKDDVNKQLLNALRVDDGKGNFDGEIFKLLLKTGISINSLVEEGGTPLHYCAKYRTTSRMEFLIKNGADLNAFDSNGYQALHCAVAAGDDDSIKTLVSLGADLNAKTKDGQSCVDIAKKLNNYEIINVLGSQARQRRKINNAIKANSASEKTLPGSNVSH